MLLRLLVIATTLAALPALAADNLELRGVTLGMTKPELAALHPAIECDPATDQRLAEETCVFRGFGPQPDAPVLVSFTGGKVVQVTAALDQTHFAIVADGLATKYGAPDTTESKTVGNALGGQFESRKLTWADKTRLQNLDAIERAGRVDRSMIMLVDLKAKLAAMQRMKAGSTDNL